MKHVRSTWFGAFATLGVLVLGVPADAQTMDDKTIVTVSGAVSLPGRTLPAGKYVFRLHDSPGNRHIVQVMSGDDSKMIAQLLAVPANRNEVTDDTVITFAERASTRPPAIRYWFYPGKNIGHEFVYPKAQAMQIAAASNQPVQSTTSPTGTVEEMKTAEVTAVSSSDAQTAATQPRAESTQARAEQQPSAADPVPPSTSQTTRSTQLPQTASPLPLVAALGLLSLGGALATRALRRRVS